jgi:uncharacterized protein YndB with AHSA1/START domain
MEKLELTQTPVMKTAMLIRKPAREVFEAFVDPSITTKFWFTKGSGRLEVGKTIEWSWEMFGVSAGVVAKVLEPGKRIEIEWPSDNGMTHVEWRFEAQRDGTTFVRVQETGFQGDGDSLVKQVADSTQGFSLVLAGAKAFLEHGLQLNLVADRYPKGVEKH